MVIDRIVNICIVYLYFVIISMLQCDFILLLSYMFEESVSLNGVCPRMEPRFDRINVSLWGMFRPITLIKLCFFSLKCLYQARQVGDVYVLLVAILLAFL